MRIYYGICNFYIRSFNVLLICSQTPVVHAMSNQGIIYRLPFLPHAYIAVPRSKLSRISVVYLL
jgi:hypothetical protein